MQHEVAIIGGGRWGRVILSVLTSAGLPVKQIHWVTQVATAEQAVSSGGSDIPVRIVPKVEDIEPGPTLSIIANAARNHGGSARALITRGSHLLIEKPVVLSVQEAEELQTLADRAGVVLLPGLIFRFASYLHRFAEEVARLESSPSIEIHWTDATGETRYGERKIFDATINVADDVMPHIWTVLSVLLPSVSFRPVACTSSRGGHQAIFTIAAEDISGRVVLERESDRRRRTVRFITARETLTLDFTTEPGTITVNDRTFPGDAQWESGPRPLAKQLRYFFECAERGKVSLKDRDALLASVAFSEAASALLTDAQNT